MAYLNSRNLTVTNIAGGTEIGKRSRQHLLIQNPSTNANFIELFFGNDTAVVLGQGIILEPSDVYVIDQSNNQLVFAIADTAPVTIRINEGA